ncbi:MAG: hypothetical protein K2Y29_05110 [Beijerinckiaceae bacterium]|nr:hypothetical protein [Beijerinckiaceae bacterium]
MEQKSARELRAFAEISSDPPPPLGRKERLERWADLLDRDPQRRISLVHELEFAPREAQAQMRADQSALSIAYEDPLFRSLGLNGDTVGDGKAFFGLNGSQTHRLLCSCMHGMSMKAGDAARMVRAVADPLPSAIARGLVIAAVCAVPALAFMFG